MSKVLVTGAGGFIGSHLVERLWCNNAKAAELIGWQPSHAGLEGFRRGLATTIDWFAAPANQVGYKPHIYNV